MSVLRTFGAVPKDVREWTKFLQNLFYSDEFTVSLTGCADPAPTGTVRYTVSAGIVVLRLPIIEGTSNTTAATLTTLPINVRPKNENVVIARVSDNGVTSFGVIVIASTGVMTLGPAAASLTFTNSGTKGIGNCDVSYSLD